MTNYQRLYNTQRKELLQLKENLSNKQVLINKLIRKIAELQEIKIPDLSVHFVCGLWYVIIDVDNFNYRFYPGCDEIENAEWLLEHITKYFKSFYSRGEKK